MKRIVFISVMNGAPWGGSEEFWYRLALWLSQQGYKIECCFFDWPEGKEERKKNLIENGCILHLLPNPKSATNYLQKLLIKARVKKQLIKLVNQQNDLTCISQGGLVDVTYPMFNSMLPHLKKFVLLYHNYNDSQILSESRKRKLFKWSHAATKNMVAAEKIFSTIRNIAGFELPAKHLLINPITIPVQHIPFPWPALNENGNYIWALIGQLEMQRKAQDILIRTLASEKWKQRNWQLDIYGDGPDKEFLSNLIISLHLEQKIFIKGHSNNVEAILSKTHLLLQITRFDAMPLSVTEAMNMARPCIVSDIGDMPLWINDEGQGYVVRNLTETCIDAVLERAWNNRSNWQQMGTNAFNMFRKKYPMPYETYYEIFFSGIIKD